MNKFSLYFNKFFQHKWLSLLLILFIMILIRSILLINESIPFNSDEAIVGLMAKHILLGERPVFFYGQAYMGSLDAYLVAFGFAVLGKHIWVIRIVQIILYSLTLSFIYFTVNIVFENLKAAFFTALIMVVAPVNVILYTTASLGGYGEALFLGCAAILITSVLLKQAKKSEGSNYFLFFLLGLATGLGIWANALSMIFTIPCILVLLLHEIRQSPKMFFVVSGILFISASLGSVFWWYSLIFSKGITVIQEITGSAVSVEQTSYLQQCFSHIISFILFAPTVLFGLRYPWSVEIFWIFAAPFILIFWGLIVFLYFHKTKSALEKQVTWILLSVIVMNFIGFVFTSFGVDPSGRYFLPIYIPLSVIAGVALANTSKTPVFFLFILVIFYHFFGMLNAAKTPPFITTQFYQPAQVDHRSINVLIDFLEANNENRGYGNYWTAYPVAFLSGESIIITPALPYHPDLKYSRRDNRYPAYHDVVLESSKVFYLTTKNPPLDRALIQGFEENDIVYDYNEIGDYHVFYNLSKVITPEQLGIYEFTSK
ncbi:MAG: hypothetical protein CVU39_03270 [Chloroflexi bacterium HGW-Chloroflexi-10]|nr:MAG: hypothetical protein CVU39_03270 [Chloroflexi bacterium HGW-Chloroflexi-10]